MLQVNILLEEQPRANIIKTIMYKINFTISTPHNGLVYITRQMPFIPRKKEGLILNGKVFEIVSVCYQISSDEPIINVYAEQR